MSAAARMIRTTADELPPLVTVDAVPGITGAAAYVGSVVSPAPVAVFPLEPDRRSRRACVVGSSDDESAGDGAGVAVPVVVVPLATVPTGVETGDVTGAVTDVEPTFGVALTVVDESNDAAVAGGVAEIGLPVSVGNSWLNKACAPEIVPELPATTP
jgi:hypothetical protein